jgi:WD-repeat region.
MQCLENGCAGWFLHSGHHLLVETYKHIISELECLGMEHVLHISNTMNEVKLQTVDHAGRNHILTLILGMNYPTSPPLIQADLPEQLIGNMKKVISVMLDIIHCVTYILFPQQIFSSLVFSSVSMILMCSQGCRYTSEKIANVYAPIARPPICI